MPTSPAAPAFVRLLAVLSSMSAAQGAQSWTVDDDGGADFTTIQAAVDAALDGDVILVEGGGYPRFQVLGKAVTIVAAPDAVVWLGGEIRIESVPAGRSVVLRGLRTGQPWSDGLEVVGGDGAVIVEECVLVGQDFGPVPGTTAFEAGAGARVGDAEVWFVRSTLVGGRGLSAAPSLPGAAGIHADRSAIAIAASVASGGDGGSTVGESAASGKDGAAGVRLLGCDLWVSGLEAVGGNGGNGGFDFDPLFGAQFGDGGDGGDGIQVLTGAPPVGPLFSTLTVRGLAAQPGGGGQGEQDGDAGVALELFGAAHTLIEFPGVPRTVWTSSPVRGGNNLRVFASGAPGDRFLLALGGPGPALPLAGQPLPLALAPGALAAVVDLGQTGPGGDLVAVFPVSPQPVGSGGVTVTTQGAVLTSDGQLELCNAAALTLLE